eukprot:gene13697-biopygen6532
MELIAAGPQLPRTMTRCEQRRTSSTVQHTRARVRARARARARRARVPHPGSGCVCGGAPRRRAASAACWEKRPWKCPGRVPHDPTRIRVPGASATVPPSLAVGVGVARRRGGAPRRRGRATQGRAAGETGGIHRAQSTFRGGIDGTWHCRAQEL